MPNAFYTAPDEERKSRAAITWNILTILVLVASLVLAALFLLVFINPSSGLNPFPPPTLPPQLALPTVTPTPQALLPPTWTPLPTKEPTLTSTLRPSSTPLSSPTAFSLPTETPFPLFTPTSGP